jgi:hypothetical protein
LLSQVDKEVIVKMCGWSNDVMLDNIYGKETIEDFTHKINAAIAHL